MQPVEVELERLPDPGEGEGVQITFQREGRLKENLPLLLKKIVTVYAGKDRFQIEYHLVNRGKDDVVLCFGIEFTLLFFPGPTMTVTTLSLGASWRSKSRFPRD